MTLNGVSKDSPEATNFILLLVVLSIWSLIWKGIAMWHAAKDKQKGWFVVLLVVNTLGIIDILYLLFWRKKKNDKINPK